MKGMRYFKVNDKVFAKMKGFSAWPARVIGGDEKKYKVKFYGSGDIAFMKGEDLFYYLRNKGLLRKTWRNKAYNDAFLQIESDIEQEGGTDGESTIADIPLDMWSAAPEWTLSEEEEDTEMSLRRGAAADSWERLSPRTKQAYYDRPGPATVSQPPAKPKRAKRKATKTRKPKQIPTKAQDKEIFARGFLSKLKPGPYKKILGTQSRVKPKQRQNREVTQKKPKLIHTPTPEAKQAESPKTVKLPQSERIMREAFPTGFLSEVMRKENQEISVAGPSLKPKSEQVQSQEATPKTLPTTPKRTLNTEKVNTPIKTPEAPKQAHNQAVFPDGFLSKLKPKENQESALPGQQKEPGSPARPKQAEASKANQAKAQKAATTKVSVTPKQRYKQEAARARQKSSRQRVPATRSIIMPVKTKRQKTERTSAKSEQLLARQNATEWVKVGRAKQKANKTMQDRREREIMKKSPLRKQMPTRSYKRQLKTPVQPTTVTTPQQSDIIVQQETSPTLQQLKTPPTTPQKQGANKSLPATPVRTPTIKSSAVSPITPVATKASPRKSSPVKVTPATVSPLRLSPVKLLPTAVPAISSMPPPLPTGHVGASFTIVDVEHLKAIIAYADYVHLHKGHYEKKQAEERENNLSEIVISRMPSGELAAIKYNRQRVTRWRSELQRAEFEENEAKTALALKELIEQGVFTPEDGLEKFELELSLDQSTVKQMLHRQIIERKCARLQWLKNESQLAELDGKLKGSLSMDRADAAKGLEFLNKMLEVDVHPLMLKKEPHIVDTIKRLRRYVGNIADWKMSVNQLNQFNQDAEAIRDIADGIYAKYMNLFGVGDLKSTEFWDVFVKQSEILQAKCYGMTGLQFLALTAEPNSRRQLLDAADERVEKTILAATEGRDSFSQTVSVITS